jgi:hypothetical protein
MFRVNKSLRLDLSAVTGGTLPGKVGQGAVTRFLVLTVLKKQSLSVYFESFVGFSRP